MKKKGAEAVIEVDNPNRVKAKTLKARDLDVSYLISSEFLYISSMDDYFNNFEFLSVLPIC